MDKNDSQNSWYKPWWKALVLVAIFPIALSYLIWKQKIPVVAKLGAIALLWLVFIGIGNSRSSSENINDIDRVTAQQVSAPTPTPMVYSMDQKQNDFKTFYSEYEKYVDDLLQFQTFIFGESTLTTKAEYYSAFEQLKSNQNLLSDLERKPKVPESLSDYKDLQSAVNEVNMANRHFVGSIEAMQDYVNDDDAKKYQEAKDKINLGEQMIGNSMVKIEMVAKELEINLEGLSEAE